MEHHLKVKKYFLSKPSFYPDSLNKMKRVGNLSEARSEFIQTRFNNLDFLLQKRFSWMNDWISNDQLVIEIGCGAGFSQLYLSQSILLTDIIQNHWVDRIIDGTNMALPSGSVDVLIASHNIHHMAFPLSFLKECARVLKPGGVLLIQEINTSLFMRCLLKLMRHEGWSYDIDVFDETTPANDPSDPWSANCAVPELMFDNPTRLSRAIPDLAILKNQKMEAFLFPLSGGVIAKQKMPELPTWVLQIVHQIDRLLVAIFPNVFAMGRSVVMQKNKV